MIYRAFISYSHAADGRLAPALQTALHRFAKPWYRLRAVRVFRDKTTLAATPALWPSIEKALGQSDYFILLASPEAAASEWVQREVRYWIERRSDDREKMLIILTGGNLLWDAGNQDFDWTHTDALPRALERAFPQEPLFLDLRWARKEEQLSLRHPEFRDAIATLAATLHDRPKDEISGEEVRQYRIARRLAWFGVTALLTLTVLASGLGYFANEKRKEAEQQQQIALARQLAAQSALANVQQAHLLPQSVLLGLEAVRRFRSVETEQGLRERVALLPKPIREMRATGMVLAVGLSPDGSQLAAAGARSVRLWETASGREVRTLNHGDLVRAVSFHPGGRYLATGGWDGTAQIWDLERGVQIARLQHEDGVESVHFSPDGEYLVTTVSGLNPQYWNCAWLWRALDGQQLARVCHADRGSIKAVRFAPDGRHFATASFDNTVRMWQTASGVETMRLVHEAPVEAIAFDRTGTSLASGSQDGRVRKWDLRTAKEISGLFMSHQAAVKSVNFGQDDKRIVTASEDHTARVWDSHNGREVSRMAHEGAVTAAIFSPDGKEVATLDGSHSARVWNAANGQESLRAVHEATVNAVSFSPDGRFLISASGHVELKTGRVVHPAVLLWDRSAGGTINRFGHRDSVDELAFSPNSRYVATGSWDHTARVSDARTGEERFRVTHRDKVGAIAFSRDSRWFASGSTDGVRVLDLESGQVAALTDGTSLTRALSFSPDGKHLAAGSVDGIARVWEIATGNRLLQFRHEDVVVHIAYSADGRHLFTSDRKLASLRNAADGTPVRQIASSALRQAAPSPDSALIAALEDRAVKIWSASNGAQLATVKHDDFVKGFAWHPDSPRMLTWDNYGVRLWDAHSGRLIREFVHRNTFRARFTPDKQNVVLIGGDHAARVLAIDTGREVARLLHTTQVHNVVPSPDGEYIATAATGNVVTIWRWRLEDVAGEACRRLTRNLTFDEWKLFFGDEPYRRTCPNLQAHPTVIEATLDMAREGNDRGFAVMARHLETLEPAIDPARLQTEGRRQAAIGNGERAVRKGEESIRAGRVTEGLSSLKAAQTALGDAQKIGQPHDIPVELWNRIAWLGSIWGKAPEFLYSAEQAVAVAPSMPEIRDTRGVARALSGNVGGAIEDLEAFVAGNISDDLKSRRVQWIDTLRKGGNPFTREELEHLRRE